MLQRSSTLGQLRCNGADSVENGLERLPEFVTVFRHVDAGCESRATRFLA